MSVKKVAAKKQPPAEAPVKKAATKKAGPAKPEVDHGNGRKVVYDTINVSLYAVGSSLGLFNCALAKRLLGWFEVPDDDAAPLDFDLKDNYGTKIRLLNNITNRPLRMSLAKTWESEVLHDRWNGGMGNGPNGETMIIGRTGLCLDCQHRLVGLVLAWQEWTENAGDWPHWKTEPAIECLVVTGISESSKVVDTINTGEPRSLADVLFRDNQYFAGLVKGERVKVTKIAENAIRMLGHRTAAFAEAFAPQRTHSEMIDFFHRHSKLMACVQFIHEAETEGSISGVIPLGAAAALMFLMGSSGDTGEKYNGTDTPNDGMLKWGHKDLAEKFWEAIGNGARSMFPIKECYSEISKSTDSISRLERMAVVIKAWNLFSVGKPLTAANLMPEYIIDDESGEKSFDVSQMPLVSAIDKGSPKKTEPESDADDETPIEAEEVSEDQKKIQKKTRGKLARPLHTGDHVWVVEDPVEASWSGELMDLAGKNAKVKVSKGFAGAGKTEVVQVAKLSLVQPS